MSTRGWAVSQPQASTRARAIAFVKLGRPHFLVGGLLFYGLGAAVAVACGAPLRRDLYLWGQLGITAVQLMTHYANDYFDLAADRANTTPTRFSGGSRVLSAGVLPPGLALSTAGVLAAVGLLVAARLAITAGPGGGPAAATLLLAEALAWCYSARPFVLHSRGWGELTTAVVVTGLTPLTGFCLQAGHLAPAPASALPPLAVLGLALLAPFGLQFAMLLAIEFPDAAGDAATGKRTLVVRWGARTAAALYRAVLVAVYGALPLALLAGMPRAAVAGAALAAPLAAVQFRRLGRDAWRDPKEWESLAFWAVASVVLTAAGELGAFVWLAARG